MCVCVCVLTWQFIIVAVTTTVLSGWFLATMSCSVEQTLCNTSKCELQLQLGLQLSFDLQTSESEISESSVCQYIDIGGRGLRSIQVRLVLFNSTSLLYSDIQMN